MPGNVAWAIRWLQEDAPPSIEGQCGDDTLVKKVVPPLKDMGISFELACDLVAEHYNHRCQPPWQLGDCEDKDNLFVKIANGYRYCTQRAPGEGTPEALFADAPLPSEEELKQLDAWWKAHDAPHREKRLRRMRAYLSWRRQFPATARISVGRRRK